MQRQQSLRKHLLTSRPATISCALWLLARICGCLWASIFERRTVATGSPFGGSLPGHKYLCSVQKGAPPWRSSSAVIYCQTTCMRARRPCVPLAIGARLLQLQRREERALGHVLRPACVTGKGVASTLTPNLPLQARCCCCASYQSLKQLPPALWHRCCPPRQTRCTQCPQQHSDGACVLHSCTRAAC